MNKVVAIDGERSMKEAWTTAVENSLMLGGMLLEEAREKAKQLAGKGWKDQDAEKAASEMLREMGWSAEVDDEVCFPLAKTPMMVVGLEED